MQRNIKYPVSEPIDDDDYTKTSFRGAGGLVARTGTVSRYKTAGPPRLAMHRYTIYPDIIAKRLALYEYGHYHASWRHGGNSACGNFILVASGWV